MQRIEKVLYTAKAHTTGGRDGASRTSDGRLDVKLSSPGTSGTGTNPEQLFAAGWSGGREKQRPAEAGEAGWIGTGRARLKVVKRIVRCAATNVDPTTGVRDLAIPETLLKNLGHADCGVYAEVVGSGDIAVGDWLQARTGAS